MTGAYVLCAPYVVHAKQQPQLLCGLSVAVPQLRFSPDSTAHICTAAISRSSCFHHKDSSPWVNHKISRLYRL